MKVLRECIDQQLNAKEIVNKVTERVHQFVKDAEQSDDLTLFVIRLPQKAQKNS
jgi:serine phosphatase RsbU (regulator of sigma subunit)